MKEREGRVVRSWAQVEGLALSRFIGSPQTDGREYRRDKGLRRKMEKV